MTLGAKNHKSSKAPRGRPRLDLGLRARNLVWYAMLKTATGLSDDLLDQTFAQVSADIRTRIFYRIRSGASSPTSKWGYRSNGTVFDRVHEEGRFETIRRAFESPLWQVLSDPSLVHDDFSRIIENYVSTHGWFRPDSEFLVIGSDVLGRPLLESTDNGEISGEYSAMLHHLVEARTLDGLAVICALFREAYLEYDLERAVAIEAAVMGAVSLLVMERSLPERLGILVQRLVVCRVLANNWAEPVVKSSKPMDLVNAYIDRGPPPRNGRAQYPIVQHDEAVARILNLPDHKVSQVKWSRCVGQLEARLRLGGLMTKHIALSADRNDIAERVDSLIEGLWGQNTPQSEADENQQSPDRYFTPLPLKAEGIMNMRSLPAPAGRPRFPG